MSAYAYTLNYAFIKANYASRGWHEEEYSNLDKLDALLQTLVSESDIPYIVATGSSNAYVATYAPAVGAYTPGLILTFLTNFSNTGAATLNVNGLGAKNLFRGGAALSNGDLPNNAYVKVFYDGTRFQVLEPRNTTTVIADGSIDDVKLTTGAPTWDGSGNLSVAGNTTVTGSFVGASLFEAARRAFVQNDSATFPSNKITFSTADPSGGSNGDIWIKHAA